MSDEKKELTSNLTLFYQSYRRQHFYDSEELKKAEETYDKIRQLIQQKPEINNLPEEYVEGKARELYNTWILRYVIEEKGKHMEMKDCEDFITQIVSDVRGGKVEGKKNG